MAIMLFFFFFFFTMPTQFEAYACETTAFWLVLQGSSRHAHEGRYYCGNICLGTTVRHLWHERQPGCRFQLNFPPCVLHWQVLMQSLAWKCIFLCPLLACMAAHVIEFWWLDIEAWSVVCLHVWQYVCGASHSVVKDSTALMSWIALFSDCGTDLPNCRNIKSPTEALFHTVAIGTMAYHQSVRWFKLLSGTMKQSLACSRLHCHACWQGYKLYKHWG